MTTHRDALLVEREGYVRRGLKARVELVDAELARLPEVADDAPVEDQPPTPEAPDGVPPGVEHAVPAGPRKRAPRKAAGAKPDA